MVGGLREVWVRQEKGYIMDTSYRMYLKRAGIRSGNMKVLYAVCVRNDAADGKNASSGQPLNRAMEISNWSGEISPLCAILSHGRMCRLHDFRGS